MYKLVTFDADRTVLDLYSFRSRHYLPYWELTVRSLGYCCKRLHLPLRAGTEQHWMNPKAELTGFPDSLEVLRLSKK